MNLNFSISESNILEFLHRQGYEVKAFRQVIPATEEMLVSESECILHTFTATKDGEVQSDKNLYLKVFEREVRQILRQIR